MTTTPSTEDLRAMVGPGQEDVFDQFLAELDEQNKAIAAADDQQPDTEAGDQPKLLAGKFKSAEELEKAYLEAQKLIGRKGPQSSEPEAPTSLTREQASEHYGEFIATAAEEEGIDLSAWDQAVRQGGDTKELREKLAAKTGIPVQLIEQYEAAYRPTSGGGDQATLSDADVADLKAGVGGEEEFARLSQWAASNLSAEELARYNDAVDSGNKAAVAFALQSFKAMSAAPAKPGEPELIGGGRPAKVEVFASQQEAIEAMRKTDSKGRNLYREDPKYREWFERTMARSTFSA